MRRTFMPLAAGVLLLTACATHAPVAGRNRAYAQHGTRHAQHASRRGQPAGQEAWTVICDASPALPPTVPQPCRLQTAVRQAGPVPAAATISSADGGQTWTVAAMPSPGAVRLKVGGRDPVDADCGRPGDACTISGEDAARLTREFQAGRAVDAQVLTTGGALDRQVSLHGFSRELTKARALLAPPGDQAAPSDIPAAAPSATAGGVPAAAPAGAAPVAAAASR